MKKTISLILGMFLLLTGCGKSSKLIRPTDSAETQETTWSESKPQSDESTEKKEETIEQKPATNSWITKELIAIAIGTAIGAYALYKFMDLAINADYKIPGGEEDDEYSAENIIHRRQGLNFEIYNERWALDAEERGLAPNVVKRKNIEPEAGEPTRLVSKTGKIVRIDHEAQYKAKWNIYKKQRYQNHKFD